jgi:2-keto-4-pentenoate hydratase/2-oxohepta-3-ene-1,7-dioic acid hydratase in catechol pathway
LIAGCLSRSGNSKGDGGKQMRGTHKALLPVLTVLILGAVPCASAEVVRYVRFEHGGASHYGIHAGDGIQALSAAPWAGGRPTGVRVDADDVELLAPVDPRQVFAVGFNYRSHQGNRELPARPPIFLKLPASVIGPGADIVFPPGAGNVHYEAELVLVIGKTASRVSADEAGAYIFGVTAGNDVSERDWQAEDLQWFRSKAADTFAPLGPAVVTGLDYRDLLVESRLNGKTMQSQRSRDHIHDAHAIVSHISTYTTLYPGDVIFTGTPGETSAMTPGDIIEIEVEGVGVLRNRIGTPID